MTIDDLMTNSFLAIKSQVIWEQRDLRKVKDLTRAKISEYFSRYYGNTLSIFISYQLNSAGLGFLDNLFRRNPIFEDWIFKNDETNIKVIPWSRKGKGYIIGLDYYLENAQSVRMTFMYGTHINGNCVIDYNLGQSRIGVVLRDF